MNAKERYDATIKLIAAKIPNFEVGFKDESKWMGRLGKLMKPFCPSFMTDYTTTFYPKVWFPSRKWLTDRYESAQEILCHEFVHLWDRQNEGTLWTLKYAMPQLFALSGLAAFVAIPTRNPWWLLALIPAVWSVMPKISPAYWRMKSEMRGYAMSMAVDIWNKANNYDTPGSMDFYASTFVGPDYFWMWSREADVRKRLANYAKAIKDGTIFDEKDSDPFKIVYKFINDTRH